MDIYNAGEETGNSYVPMPPPIPGVQSPVNDMELIARNELQNLYAELHQLKAITVASSRQISEQSVYIAELLRFTEETHSKLRKFDQRMAQLENENAMFKCLLTPEFDLGVGKHGPEMHQDETENQFLDGSAVRNHDRDGRDRSVSRSVRHDTARGIVKKSKAQKKFVVKLKMPTTPPALAVGLQTPEKTGGNNVTGTFDSPLTPGRIGPVNSSRRGSTGINKRMAHNLDKFMAPANVRIPLVPLTDTEVLVFFFQSLARPIVALRMYARNWGPASIIDALSEHREIQPPYLRNTCSVKCITAIRKGVEQFGQEWELAHRKVFKDADDFKATDLIQQTNIESERVIDVDIRELCVNLKKYPEDNVTGGIFTRCVKHCMETSESWTTETIVKLAERLGRNSAFQQEDTSLNDWTTFLKMDPDAPSLGPAMAAAAEDETTDSI